MTPFRPPIPSRTALRVLTRCRRRCALCFGLFRDSSVKQGQIAHLDRDRANNAIGNLAFLCQPHHDDYDSLPRQSRRWSRGEVRKYLRELRTFLEGETALAWTDTSIGDQALPRSAKPAGCGPAVYALRIPIYAAVKVFLDGIVTAGSVDLKQLRALVRATDEALFLFGPEVSEYIRTLYSNGVKLRKAGRILANLKETAARRQEASEQDEELLNYFTAQYNSSRELLLPYLRLHDAV